MHITYTMKTIWWAQNDEDGLGAEWMEWAEIPKHKCNLQNNKWHSNLKLNSSMQPSWMHGKLNVTAQIQRFQAEHWKITVECSTLKIVNAVI